MKKYCITLFPRVGLANKLVIWSNAIIFAHLNNCELVCGKWWHIPIRNILREKKIARFYFNYFVTKRYDTLKILYLLCFKRKVYINDNCKNLEQDCVYIFNQYPKEINPFEKLKPFRKTIKQNFCSIISAKISNKINQYSIPEVAIHIRLGDFKVMVGEMTLQNGHSRLPLTYYSGLINTLRTKLGKLKFIIFSDGTNEELQEILAIQGVSLFKSGNDLVDLLLMSKSEIIVCSPSSTYSYWAAFISNADIIHHANYKIYTRSDEHNFEGSLEEYLIYKNII